MRHPRCIVLAGTAWEAHGWIREQPQSPDGRYRPGLWTYDYVAHAAMLRGMEAERYEITGTFWRRDDAPELLELATLAVQRSQWRSRYPEPRRRLIERLFHCIKRLTGSILYVAVRLARRAPTTQSEG